MTRGGPSLEALSRDSLSNKEEKSDGKNQQRAKALVEQYMKEQGDRTEVESEEGIFATLSLSKHTGYRFTL